MMLIVKSAVDEEDVFTQKRETVGFAYDNCFHAKQCVLRRPKHSLTHQAQRDLFRSAGKCVFTEHLDLESSKPGDSIEHIIINVVC
jgi:hypothetical protein